MKHVTEFEKINEEDEYIDIFNSDKKSQIMDILIKYKSRGDDNIWEGHFDKVADEISKLFN